MHCNALNKKQQTNNNKQDKHKTATATGYES